jgi:heme exporter protein B
VNWSSFPIRTLTALDNQGLNLNLLFPMISIVRRDLLIAYRHKIEFLTPLLFFILITLLFPLAVTTDPKKLSMIGPGVIWISLLFANMLSIENLFLADYEDGTLEQIALNPRSLSLLLSGKLIAHWLVTAAPLLAVSLIMSHLFFIPKQAITTLFVSILLGSPVLTFIGAIGSALTLGLRNRGLILILLIVPLYLPVLIFATGAVNDASIDLPVTSALLFLGAFLTLTVTFVPLALAAAIKISLE